MFPGDSLGPISDPPSPPAAASSGASTKAQRSRLACLRCRTKKTKCDGNTPCNQCIKTIQDCSYEERRKPELSERALSEKLATLQSRYDALTPSTPSFGSSGGSMSSPASTHSASSGQDATLRRQPIMQASISPDVRNHLIGVALRHMPRCSFNVNRDLFMGSLELPPPQQPHPSLINALMLMGIYYGGEPPRGTPPAEYFVQQIRSQLAGALSDVDRVVHYVAASIMLALWLIQNARFLEGQYEICSTARLAIDCGLHQIDESVVRSVIEPGYVAAPSPGIHGGILGPPSTVEDLEARVSIFWGIFLLDKHAALMTGLPAAFDDLTSNPNLRITTVWPKPINCFAGPWRPNDFSSLDDLMFYPQYKPAVPSTFIPREVQQPQTMHAASSQAMALLLRGVKLSVSAPKTLEEAQTLRESLITLNRAITSFTGKLPTDVSLAAIQQRGAPYALGADTAHMAFLCLAEVRCAAYVIIIKMHQAAELLDHFQGGVYRLTSGLGLGEEKRLAAARATTTIAQEVFVELNRPGCNLAAKDGLCLVIGFLWTSAAVVFIDRIANLRKEMSVPGANSFALAREIQSCSGDLGKTVDAIRRLAKVFSVLDLQVQKIDTMVKETLAGPSQ